MWNFGVGACGSCITLFLSRRKFGSRLTFCSACSMALQRCFWKFARMAARFRGVAARLLRRSQCFKPAHWRRRGIWHDEEAREHRKEGEQWVADYGRFAVRLLFSGIIQRTL